MDIVRLKNNNHFYYVNKHTKKHIVNKELLIHIKTLKIPKVYTNVSISSKKKVKFMPLVRIVNNGNNIYIILFF